MAAAPQYGTLSGVDAVTGQAVAVDVYLSDVVGALGNFDSGAGAGTGSETFYQFPSPTVITDFSVKTGLTDTTVGRLTANGAPLPNMIRWANHVNTLNQRPRLNLKLKAGTRIGIVQLA